MIKNNYLATQGNQNVFLNKSYPNLIDKYLSQTGDFQITINGEGLIDEDDVHLYFDVITYLPYQLFEDSG